MKTINTKYQRELLTALVEAGNDFVATEKEIEAQKKVVTFEEKTGDGVTILFAIKDGNPVLAIMDDTKNGFENEWLDKENTEMAYSDFEKWLVA